MKLVWKLSIPQICIVVSLGVISFFVINMFFIDMRDKYVEDIAEDHIESITKWVDAISNRVIEETSLFVELPVVYEAYEIALSGDIDDPYSPQSQQARELLRDGLRPMLESYAAATGEEFQLHFHLPNGRSLVRLWREKNASADGADIDISDDISAFRATVMNTIKTGKATTGIESGVGGFAVRGVVPIIAADGGYLGSAEKLQNFNHISEALPHTFVIYANNDMLGFAADLRDRETYPLTGDFVRIVGTEKSSLFESFITPEFLANGREKLSFEKHRFGTFAAFPLNDYQDKQVGVIVLAVDTQSLFELSQLAAIVLALMLTGMVAAPTVTLLLRIRVLAAKPLSRMKAMIRDIVEDRADLTVRVPAAQSDEIGDLARWFNTLTTKLSNIMNERQAMFERMEELKLEAEVESRAKSVFLAQMSHEMRTPLNAVLGLSELAMENDGVSTEIEAHLDKIYNAGSTLLSIVNDILDISKIEEGKFVMIEQEYDVPSLINDAITQNLLRANEKSIRFVLELDEKTPVRLCGDELRIKQIINNLLSNAFKYTERGTITFEVGYERNGDTGLLTLRVSDTGIGIRTEDFDRVFTDYTRLGEAADRKTGGTGLGLSITKRLVELMDGTIGFESEFGKGSVFTVKIRQRYAGDSVIGFESAAHLKNFRYNTSKRHRGSRLNRVRISSARVLVVDDNLTNLDIARGFLEPYGMEVDCVTSGRAAIDLVRDESRKYDAIFMDHMMPEMDGVEATRIIREEIGSDYAKNVPVIALTANAIVGNEEEFLSKGFNAFISKPIDIFRLDEVVRRQIRDRVKAKDDLPGDVPEYKDRRKAGDRRKSRDRRTAQRRNNPSPWFLADDINGLDWLRGIEIFENESAYRTVLHSFAVNTKSLLNSISEVNAQTLARYAITVHGIKSSSRSICADAVGSLAESLEFAAKAENLDFVQLNNPAFLRTVHKLIEEIEAAQSRIEKANAKPVKESPDDAALANLAAACENYDMDGIEAAMREIESYEYTAAKELVEWLSDNVSRLNYARIAERLR